LPLKVFGGKGAYNQGRMKRRLPPILGIFFTVLLDMLSFGLVIPDIQLRGDFLGAEGWMRGLLIATFSIAQLLTAPFMGRFSDVYGRRRVLLLTTLLAAGSHAVYAHAGELWIMFLSRALAGVAGANIGVAYAYVADATAPKDRAKSFGLIGIAFGLGFIFGPPLGAFLLSLGYMPGQQVTHTLIEGGVMTLHPFSPTLAVAISRLQAPSPMILGYTAAALALLNFVYIYFFLPETLRRGEEAGRLSTLQSLRLAVLSPGFGVLMALFFAASYALSNLESTYFLLSARVFNLNQVQTALILTFIGVISAIMQGGIIRMVTPRFGEVRVVRFAYLIQVPALALIPFAGPWWPHLLVVAVLAIGLGLAQPSLGSLISRGAPAQLQGSTFGVTQALGALARILGPITGNSAFDVRPWLPYLIAASVMLFPAVASWFLRMPAEQEGPA
jgi:MFS transporter, DHA1 family, tetracycline resistance protein